MADRFTSCRPLAAITYPMAFVLLLSSALLQKLYETEQGDGMVVFGRHRKWDEALVALALVAAPLGLSFWTFWSLGGLVGAIPLSALALIFLPGAILRLIADEGVVAV